MLATDEFSLEYVRPIESHGRLIMSWRNDPETLAASFHSRPKQWEAFIKEFKQFYFAIPALPPLFILYQKERVAFVRFRLANHPKNPSERCCEISINMAPEKRGQGFGTSVIKLCTEWAEGQGFAAVVAEIKQGNEQSIQAFKKADFTKIAERIKRNDESSEGIPYIQLIHEVSSNHSQVFIIAEIGSNWRVGTPKRDLEMAKTLISVAANAGVSAAKFQVFKPETVYVKNAGSADYLCKEGINEEMSELYRDHALPYEMIPELAQFCSNAGVEFMASVFSPADFDAVDPYVKRHKLASYEIGNVPLIDKMAASGKPVILSTGASTEEEIDWVVQYFFEKGLKDLTLMQCTAAYPAPLSTMHLRTISTLKERFRLPVGLSDHSTPATIAPTAAVALGASVIEKHITLCKDLPFGPDEFFALEPEELALMVKAVRDTEAMLGQWVKEVLPEERELEEYAKRGIQATQTIEIGQELSSKKNTGILRPGQQKRGIHPKYLNQLEGKKATRHIPEGDGIQFGDFA